MSAQDPDDLELHAFLDGELSPEQEAQILARLDTDPSLRARLRRQAELQLPLMSGLTPAFRGSSHALAHRLADLLEQRAHIPGTPRWRRWLPRGLAAMLLLGLGWTGHAGLDRLLGPRLPPYALETVQQHELFAHDPTRPVEIPASRNTEMVTWLSERLGRPVEVPDLRLLGLELVGGRLTGSEDGPLAQLLYQDRAGRRLTLSLIAAEADVPEEDVPADGVETASVDGLSVAYWRGEHFAYALVAVSPPTQVERIASAMLARSR
ncbi:anti-sigma factor family protein [Oleisolibacter albus]|uniref:anti-sigma factor family protein n=1 Tax=Oleisolibacter albus TaxID=2171757 RepID=UPI000DF39396|nr:anti-sigma factor [Oleisolibacter albus]